MSQIFTIEVKRKGPFWGTRKRQAVLEKELESAINEAVLRLRREIVLRTPSSKGGGILKKSIIDDVKGRGLKLVGEVGTPMQYAQPVEHGRRPNAPFPNRDNLELWVKRQFGVAGVMLKRLTFLIGQKIANRGIKAVEMFEKGARASDKFIMKRFDHYGFQVVRKLS